MQFTVFSYSNRNIFKMAQCPQIFTFVILRHDKIPVNSLVLREKPSFWVSPWEDQFMFTSLPDNTAGETQKPEGSQKIHPSVTGEKHLGSRETGQAGCQQKWLWCLCLAGFDTSQSSPAASESETTLQTKRLIHRGSSAHVYTWGLLDLGVCSVCICASVCLSVIILCYDVHTRMDLSTHIL